MVRIVGQGRLIFFLYMMPPVSHLPDLSCALASCPLCRQSWVNCGDAKMVECEQCHLWVHGACDPLAEKALSRDKKGEAQKVIACVSAKFSRTYSDHFLHPLSINVPHAWRGRP